MLVRNSACNNAFKSIENHPIGRKIIVSSLTNPAHPINTDFNIIDFKQVVVDFFDKKIKDFNM
jgi:hypothetical protein